MSLDTLTDVVPNSLHGSGNSPVAKSWCFTHNKVVKLSFIWTMSNFSCCRQETGELVKSSIFTAGPEENAQWCLHAAPRGIDRDSREYLSLHLLLASSDTSEVRITYSLSVLNNKHAKCKTLDSIGMITVRPGTCVGAKYFAERNFLLNEKNSVLLDDKLMILCEISVFAESINISGQDAVFQSKVPVCQLSEDLGAHFDNKQFSDVILAVGDKEYQAHKVILAARSPVFAAMFEHEMKERKSNRVEITDVEYEVLGEMLRFVYTGCVPNLEKMAEGLLAVADKYALERLKMMCEEALCRSLSAESAADILIVADNHSAEQLKAYTIQFISNSHVNKVMDTAGWKNILHSHPQLIADVVRPLASQQQQILSSFHTMTIKESPSS